MTIKAIVKEGCKIVQPVGADAPEITTKFRDPGGKCVRVVPAPSVIGAKIEIRKHKFEDGNSWPHIPCGTVKNARRKNKPIFEDGKSQRIIAVSLHGTVQPPATQKNRN